MKNEKIGFFTPKVKCAICNNETGLNRNKTKHGWFCSSCMNKLNNSSISIFSINKYSLDQLKECVEKYEEVKSRQEKTESKCVLCGNKVRIINSNRTRHGLVCASCREELWNSKVNMLNINKYSLEQLKEYTGNDEKGKQKKKEITQRIKEHKDNYIACCPSCGSTSLAAVGESGYHGNYSRAKVICMNCGKKFYPKKTRGLLY